MMLLLGIGIGYVLGLGSIYLYQKYLNGPV